jgi:prepilin peptidase CpaA
MTDDFQALAFLPGYCLVATMLIAVLTDIVSHRIPNVLIVPALSLALLIGAASAGSTGLLMSLAGLGVGLAMLLPMYSMGAMGAGDVKLLGVAGAFLGPQGALIAGIAALIAGACLAILWLAWHSVRPILDHYIGGLMQTSFKSAGPLFIEATPAPRFAHKNNRFPYAPAIAFGAAFAIWQQGLIILV